MDQVLVILVSVGSSIVVGIATNYFTFRLLFERHRAMDTEREKHITKWRAGIDDGLRDHHERIDELERDFVTREELAKAYSEMRAERQAMHQENQNHLGRIEGKIEAKREEARTDLGALALQVNELILRLASLGVDERMSKSKKRPR